MFHYYRKKNINKISLLNVSLKLFKIIDYSHPSFLTFLKTIILLNPRILFVIHCSFYKGLSILRKIQQIKRKYKFLNIVLFPQLMQKYKKFKFIEFNNYFIYLKFYRKKKINNKNFKLYLNDLKFYFYGNQTNIILTFLYSIISLSIFSAIIFFNVNLIIWIKPETNVLLGILIKILNNCVLTLFSMILN
uniref:Uncharacterized protein n=1 Tax=Lotharella vacuolata TaxID=74820 RepID=A0A0H5BQS6_9EUKA|nr:hypothetical protein [Lotharella vacuolata]